MTDYARTKTAVSTRTKSHVTTTLTKASKKPSYSPPSSSDVKSSSKIRAMIDKFESRDEPVTRPIKELAAVDVTPSASPRQEAEGPAKRVSLSMSSAAKNRDSQAWNKLTNETDLSRVSKTAERDGSVGKYGESPFWDTLNALTGGKSQTEQISLLRGIVLDLLQEVDTSRSELEQIHRELAQRDQLIRDLREERKMMREEQKCKLLSMAQALSELDQHKALMDTMKKIESDAIVPGSKMNGVVIQQLAKKVEELELQNANLLKQLASR